MSDSRNASRAVGELAIERKFPQGASKTIASNGIRRKARAIIPGIIKLGDR
jgi:hypothetical protein